MGTLCELLYTLAPELGEALSKGEWTFFAPMNSAFEDIQVVTNSLSEKKLLRIIKFHASSENIYFPWDLECTEKILMASGDMSRTKCGPKNEDGFDTKDKYQKGNGNYKLDILPAIQLPSIRACNGIVHVLDAVMLPVHGSTEE